MTSVLHYRDPIAYRSNDLMSTTNYVPPSMASVKKSPPYDGHSSGSEKRQMTPGAKKRPSRAGTRSVTTLTAAQLERKRANDREAQRAIRQRTKDHIEGLERQVRELTAQIDTNSSTKMMELIRRNEELEQENAVLRTRLSHAVAALGVPESGGTLSSIRTDETFPFRPLVGLICFLVSRAAPVWEQPRFSFPAIILSFCKVPIQLSRFCHYRFWRGAASVTCARIFVGGETVMFDIITAHVTATAARNPLS